MSRKLHFTQTPFDLYIQRSYRLTSKCHVQLKLCLMVITAIPVQLHVAICKMLIGTLVTVHRCIFRRILSHQVSTLEFLGSTARDIPYSWRPSRVKTFANFAVLQLSVKVLSPNFVWEAVRMCGWRNPTRV